MEKLLRNFVREIMLEEIGRDFKTTVDTMMDWENLPGVDVMLSPDTARNGWLVIITDDDKKTTQKFFKDETDAVFYAKNYAFSEFRKKVSSGEINTVSDFGPMQKGSRG